MMVRLRTLETFKDPACFCMAAVLLLTAFLPLAAFAKQLKIVQGDSLNISLSKETIILRRAPQRTSLSDLLIGITDSNLHNEIETETIGNEIW